MNDIRLAKRLVEIGRDTYARLNKLEELIVWEAFEYFNELGYLSDVIVDMLGYYPTDHASEIVRDCLNGEYDFDDMIRLLDEYQTEVTRNGIQ